MTAGAPPKVLHCVERLHTNAIESWLVRMYCHALSRGYAIDWWFHTQLKEPGRLESLYSALSSRVFRSPYPLSASNDFFIAFWRLCMEQRFDVVHVHSDLTSAPYAVAARLAGVRRVIVHIHNADESVPTPRAWKQRLYRPALRRVCLTLADRLVGISNHTLDTFLFERPRRRGRDIVHYYGLDRSPFEGRAPDRAAFRRELHLADDAAILLFGGRIVPEKNPVFAVDVAAELIRLQPNAVAIFAGAGSLEEAVVARARALGVAGRVRMLGWRSNLPEIMRCSDWFILPRPERPMEGFGLAVVEAQLAGLRILLSQGISNDPLLPTAVFRRLSLADSPCVWAKAALEMLEEPAPSCTKALAALRRSPMDMDYALAHLMELHA